MACPEKQDNSNGAGDQTDCVNVKGSKKSLEEISDDNMSIILMTPGSKRVVVLAMYTFNSLTVTRLNSRRPNDKGVRERMPDVPTPSLCRSRIRAPLY